ncbi:MAG: hypothetical protein CMB86_05260 [Flammeovirgaceae bacterium]|nr:hypothetical protein [Flammeovirgaceae bacterium]|tara:strand:- start:12606 stop:13196 length:591 start_codon:yes stop_codon:yes gene_type:complete
MLINFLILYLSFFSLDSHNSSHTDWKLKKEENDIKVFIRKNEINNVEYLAETRINGNIDSILEIIMDYDNSHKWMYKLENSKILEKKYDSLFYVYFTMEMGWPLKKRDLVSDVKVEKNDDFISVSLTSSPKYIPLDNNYIRISDSKSVWKLSKVNDLETKVSLQSYAVIEGLPSFVVELFIVDGPIYSLTNLKNKF